MIELTDTNASEIAAEFVRGRIRAGSPAMGMVMTLIVVVDEDDAETAMDAAKQASHEHPARVLGVILGDGRGAAQVNAQVGDRAGLDRRDGPDPAQGRGGQAPRVGGAAAAAARLPGRRLVARRPPGGPRADPLGRLARRRITDSAFVSRGKLKALREQCAAYSPGNTDLAWTRITPWRALLAAALDQQPLKVRRVVVSAERISPSADLLLAWLHERLRVPAERKNTKGPGITEVVMETADGDIRISRGDGKLAMFSSPDRPDRPVALKRRDLPELLGEELRWSDEDDIYAATAQRLLAMDTP